VIGNSRDHAHRPGSSLALVHRETEQTPWGGAYVDE